MKKSLLWLCAFSLLSLAPLAWAAPLKIGVLPASDSLALHVAKDEGLFDEKGVAVELVPFQSALEQAAALRSGAVQGNFCDILTVISMNASGVAERIIAVMSQSGPGSRFFGIAVSPGSAVTGVEGLKGAKIAISRGTIIDYMLGRILEGEGYPADYAETLDIRQIAVRLQMLMSGKVDAALLPEPLLTLVESKGARVIADNTGLNVPLAVLALREDALDASSVRAIRAALSEAMRRINEDPEKYRAVMLEKKLLPKEAAASYRMLFFDPACTPVPVPSLEYTESVADWMMQSGILRRKPEVGNIVRDVAE